ncbi:leucine-rich repeat domain-containing protein [Pseudomonadota bacterium]
MAPPFIKNIKSRRTTALSDKKVNTAQSKESIAQKSEHSEYIEEELAKDKIASYQAPPQLELDKKNNQGLLSFETSDIKDDFIISKTKPKTEIKDPPIIPSEVIIPEAKVAQKEPFISPILDLATTRPAESIKDIDIHIDEDKLVEPDKRMSQKEFELMLKEGDYKYLDLSHFKNVTDFTPLRAQKSLIHLSLCGNSQLHNISFLKELTNLEVLDLGLTGITDISYIKYLTNLKILNIRYTEVRDVYPISHLKNLRDLIIMGCTKLINISPLKENAELRLIDANDALSMSDISFVKHLKKLENLFVDFCPLKSIDAIRELYSLKAFSLESKNLHIRNMAEVLSDLTDLRFLNLRKGRVNNIKPLEKLTKMIMIDVGFGNFISVEPLADMTNLRRAHIDENSGIVDISPLEKMKDLMVLDVSGDRLTDVSVLKNFDHLLELDMIDNILLQDIYPIENCLKLEELYLDGCIMLSDLYPLRKLRNLQFATFTRMPRLTDISPLKEASMFVLNIDSTSVPYSQITELKHQRALAMLSTVGSNEHYRRAKMTFGRRRKLNNLRISLDW